MRCPNCRSEFKVVIEECPKCGLIFAKWRAGTPNPFREAPRPKEAARPMPAEWIAAVAAAVLLAAVAWLWRGLGEEGEGAGLEQSFAPAPAPKGASSAAIELSDSDFDEFTARPDIPSLIMFYTRTCGICRAAAPALDRLSAESGGRYRVGVVDIDENPGLQSRWGVRGVPVFLFFKGGSAVLRLPGAPSSRTEDIYLRLKEVAGKVFK
ncbi:MAG: glutaredoxin family protein [Elusimicrobia bacterium]|nr:glutaredoxin family protein [Elusimicrobiota bacterium]